MINTLIEGTKTNLEKIILPDDYVNRHITKETAKNLIVLGMRRVGKSRFLKYKALESKLNNDEILFIDFDAGVLSMKDFINNETHQKEFVESITKILSMGKVKLVLLDEIQRVKN